MVRRASVPFVIVLAVGMLPACQGTDTWPPPDDVGVVDSDPGWDQAPEDIATGDLDPASDDGPGPQDQGSALDVEVITSCPALPPAGVWPVIPCSGPLHCEYGNECCCGRCSAAAICECGSMGFECYASDFCLGAPCSPGCDSPGLYETAFGCRTCDDIATGVRDGIAAALGDTVACAADGDCTAWTPPRECLGTCRHAVHVQQASGLEAKLAVVGDQWCQWASGCHDAEPPCEEGDPVCLAGACAIVGPCDGVKVPLGSLCDDGDRCTEDDVCVSKGQCTGQALLCDDGNPCTADRCDRAGGCIHDSLDRIACPAAGACVPGATCAQEVCTDSIREGWVRTLAVPGNAYPFSAAAHPDGGHVLLVNRQVGLRLVPHLVRVDAAGSLVSDIPLDLLKSTEGRGLAMRPDGTAVVLAFDYPDTAVLAVAPDGTILWRTVLDTASADPVALSIGAGGRIALVGSRTPVPNVPSGWFACLDSDGKVLQDVDLGAVSHAGMAKIRPAGDGWAMLLGVLDSAPQGDLTDIAFVRVDGAGKVVVQRTFHEDGNDFVIGFVGLPDGAFVATGNRILYLDEGKGDVGWIRRIEADGAPGWSVVRETMVYGPAAWDGSSVVVLGAGILHVTADGQMGVDQPIGAVLPGGASEILPDALGLVLAGMSSGSADQATPWLARLFAPCDTGTCVRPGCP